MADEIDRPGSLYTVFAVLSGLSLLTIVLSTQSLGTWNLVLQLLIGAIQAVIVAQWWMHLKRADKVTWLTAGAALFWMGILFVMLLADFVTRHTGGI